MTDGFAALERAQFAEVGVSRDDDLVAVSGVFEDPGVGGSSHGEITGMDAVVARVSQVFAKR